MVQMLEIISQARFNSPFILFVDHNSGIDVIPTSSDKIVQSASSFFLSVLKSYVKASEHVTHVLCWERKTVKQLKLLEKHDSSLLQVHDCLADFHGWINPEERKTGFLSMIQKSLSEDCKEINVVIDSLSNPLFTIGFGQCLQELQQMITSSSKGPTIRQLMCLVHNDLLPCGPSSIAHVKHLASTIVELKNQVAYITHCKSGGHVLRKEEEYSVSPDGDVSFLSIKASKQIDEQTNTVLPQNVASFRVSLTEKEKEDRNKLVLPYMHTGGNSEETKEEGGGGKVFYQPDAVDDWDDEDPDDDLDI